MLDIAEGLVTLPVAITLLFLLVVVAYAVFAIGRHRRHKRLLDAGADSEFIALVNDRHAFCDSEEEYKALLERESDDPPPQVAENGAEPQGRNERGIDDRD